MRSTKTMSGECNIVTSEHCSVRVSVDATLHCIAPAPIQPPVSHRHKGILCLKVCLISHIRYTGSLPNVARPTKLLCLALLKHSKMLPCGEGTSKGKHSVITDGGGCISLKQCGNHGTVQRASVQHVCQESPSIYPHPALLPIQVPLCSLWPLLVASVCFLLFVGLVTACMHRHTEQSGKQPSPSSSR